MAATAALSAAQIDRLRVRVYADRATGRFAPPRALLSLP
jgi:hypothetical protein